MYFCEQYKAYVSNFELLDNYMYVLYDRKQIETQYTVKCA